MIAALVVYNRHGANPRWDPFPISHLKDLGKVVKELRRDSPHFQTVLFATLSSTILVPVDLKTIMKSLMGKVEYLAWERFWKSKVEELHSIYQRDQTKAFLTMNHLCGEGDFKKSQDQADTIPAEVLGDLREVAISTLFQMLQPGVPSANYAFIRQEPGGNFCLFVERLQTAVERSLENEIARAEIITLYKEMRMNGVREK